MTSLKSLQKLKKPKLIIFRRVVGDSMLPTLKPGKLIIASGLVKPRLNQLVVARVEGREIVKRLVKTSAKGAYIVGDNLAESSDSRKFGWIRPENLSATVIWPNKA